MSRRPLRIGFRIGLLFLVAAACDQHDPDAASPTSPIFQAALTLTASAASMPADGFSQIELIAQISADADATRRKVRFKTNSGTLLGATASDKQQIDVDADPSGVARATLQSSQTVGGALVEAAVLDGSNSNSILITKTITVDFTPVDNSAVIRLSAAAATGAADGESRIAVFADIASDLPTGSREVTFTTSLGTLAPSSGKAQADSRNRATLDLISPDQLGLARITGTVNGFSDQTTIDFGPARPDTILVTLSPASLTLGGGGTSTITATLRRLAGRGKVTDALQMEYSASRDDGMPPQLVFSEQGLTTSEKAEAKVGLGAGSTPGIVRIRVRVQGGSVTGEAQLEIKQ